MPLAAVGLILVAADSAHPLPLFSARLLFAVTLGLRIAVHLGHRVPGRRSLLADLWLLPARDLLLGWVWLRSFFTSKITWRGNDFSVDSDGVMHRI
jgi:ceramide glucosyltransferase